MKNKALININNKLLLDIEMNSYVIKNYYSNYLRPIEFNSKDILIVGAEDNDYPDWIWVTTPDANEGWAPIKYIELVEGTNKGIAKINYCARELNVKVGEKLQINYTHCGWLYATNSHGGNGWVPNECVHFA